MRPYSVHKDYRKDYIRSSRGNSRHTESSTSRRVDEINPDQMKLLSVSPFRAVIKVQDNDSDVESLSDQGDDLQRETIQA